MQTRVYHLVSAATSLQVLGDTDPRVWLEDQTLKQCWTEGLRRGVARLLEPSAGTQV